METVEQSNEIAIAELVKAIEVDARLTGNHRIVIALDRLGSPLPGKAGAIQIKEAIGVLMEWSKTFPREKRIQFGHAINAHITEAVNHMKEEQSDKNEVEGS